MATYRIAPHGATGWKVQKRFLWLWFDVTTLIGYDLLDRVWFNTAAEAKKWIDDELAVRAGRIAYDAEAARRSRAVKPEVYP